MKFDDVLGVPTPQEDVVPDVSIGDEGYASLEEEYKRLKQKEAIIKDGAEKLRNSVNYAPPITSDLFFKSVEYDEYVQNVISGNAIPVSENAVKTIRIDPVIAEIAQERPASYWKDEFPLTKIPYYFSKSEQLQYAQNVLAILNKYGINEVNEQSLSALPEEEQKTVLENISKLEAIKPAQHSIVSDIASSVATSLTYTAPYYISKAILGNPATWGNVTSLAAGMLGSIALQVAGKYVDYTTPQIVSNEDENGNKVLTVEAPNIPESTKLFASTVFATINEAIEVWGGGIVGGAIGKILGKAADRYKLLEKVNKVIPDVLKDNKIYNSVGDAFAKMESKIANVEMLKDINIRKDFVDNALKQIKEMRKIAPWDGLIAEFSEEYMQQIAENMVDQVIAGVDPKMPANQLITDTRTFALTMSTIMITGGLLKAGDYAVALGRFRNIVNKTSRLLSNNGDFESINPDVFNQEVDNKLSKAVQNGIIINPNARYLIDVANRVSDARANNQDIDPIALIGDIVQAENQFQISQVIDAEQRNDADLSDRKVNLNSAIDNIRSSFGLNTPETKKTPIKKIAESKLAYYFRVGSEQEGNAIYVRMNKYNVGESFVHFDLDKFYNPTIQHSEDVTLGDVWGALVPILNINVKGDSYELSRDSFLVSPLGTLYGVETESTIKEDTPPIIKAFAVDKQSIDYRGLGYFFQRVIARGNVGGGHSAKDIFTSGGVPLLALTPDSEASQSVVDRLRSYGVKANNKTPIQNAIALYFIENASDNQEAVRAIKSVFSGERRNIAFDGLSALSEAIGEVIKQDKEKVKGFTRLVPVFANIRDLALSFGRAVTPFTRETTHDGIVQVVENIKTITEKLQKYLEGEKQVAQEAINLDEELKKLEEGKDVLGSEEEQKKKQEEIVPVTLEDVARELFKNLEQFKTDSVFSNFYPEINDILGKLSNTQDKTHSQIVRESLDGIRRILLRNLSFSNLQDLHRLVQNYAKGNEGASVDFRGVSVTKGNAQLYAAVAYALGDVDTARKIITTFPDVRFEYQRITLKPSRDGLNMIVRYKIKGDEEYRFKVPIPDEISDSELRRKKNANLNDIVSFYKSIRMQAALYSTPIGDTLKKLSEYITQIELKELEREIYGTDGPPNLNIFTTPKELAGYLSRLEQGKALLVSLRKANKYSFESVLRAYKNLIRIIKLVNFKLDSGFGSGGRKTVRVKRVIDGQEVEEEIEVDDESDGGGGGGSKGKKKKKKAGDSEPEEDSDNNTPTNAREFIKDIVLDKNNFGEEYVFIATDGDVNKKSEVQIKKYSELFYAIQALFNNNYIVKLRRHFDANTNTITRVSLIAYRDPNYTGVDTIKNIERTLKKYDIEIREGNNNEILERTNLSEVISMSNISDAEIAITNSNGARIVYNFKMLPEDVRNALVDLIKYFREIRIKYSLKEGRNVKDDTEIELRIDDWNKVPENIRKLKEKIENDYEIKFNIIEHEKVDNVIKDTDGNIIQIGDYAFSVIPTNIVLERHNLTSDELLKLVDNTLALFPRGNYRGILGFKTLPNGDVFDDINPIVFPYSLEHLLATLNLLTDFNIYKNIPPDRSFSDTKGRHEIYALVHDLTKSLGKVDSDTINERAREFVTFMRNLREDAEDNEYPVPIVPTNPGDLLLKIASIFEFTGIQRISNEVYAIEYKYKPTKNAEIALNYKSTSGAPKKRYILLNSNINVDIGWDAITKYKKSARVQVNGAISDVFVHELLLTKVNDLPDGVDFVDIDTSNLDESMGLKTVSGKSAFEGKKKVGVSQATSNVEEFRIGDDYSWKYDESTVIEYTKKNSKLNAIGAGIHRLLRKKNAEPIHTDKKFFDAIENLLIERGYEDITFRPIFINETDYSPYVFAVVYTDPLDNKRKAFLVSTRVILNNLSNVFDEVRSITLDGVKQSTKITELANNVAEVFSFMPWYYRLLTRITNNEYFKDKEGEILLDAHTLARALLLRALGKDSTESLTRFENLLKLITKTLDEYNGGDDPHYGYYTTTQDPQNINYIKKLAYALAFFKVKPTNLDDIATSAIAGQILFNVLLNENLRDKVNAIVYTNNEKERNELLEYLLKQYFVFWAPESKESSLKLPVFSTVMSDTGLLVSFYNETTRSREEKILNPKDYLNSAIKRAWALYINYSNTNKTFKKILTLLRDKKLTNIVPITTSFMTYLKYNLHSPSNDMVSEMDFIRLLVTLENRDESDGIFIIREDSPLWEDKKTGEKYNYRKKSVYYIASRGDDVTDEIDLSRRWAQKRFEKVMYEELLGWRQSLLGLIDRSRYRDFFYTLTEGDDVARELGIRKKNISSKGKAKVNYVDFTKIEQLLEFLSDPELIKELELKIEEIEDEKVKEDFRRKLNIHKFLYTHYKELLSSTQGRLFNSIVDQLLDIHFAMSALRRSTSQGVEGRAVKTEEYLKLWKKAFGGDNEEIEGEENTAETSEKKTPNKSSTNTQSPEEDIDDGYEEFAKIFDEIIDTDLTSESGIAEEEDVESQETQQETPTQTPTGTESETNENESEESQSPAPSEESPISNIGPHGAPIKQVKLPFEGVTPTGKKKKSGRKSKKKSGGGKYVSFRTILKRLAKNAIMAHIKNPIAQGLIDKLRNNVSYSRLQSLIATLNIRLEPLDFSKYLDAFNIESLSPEIENVGTVISQYIQSSQEGVKIIRHPIGSTSPSSIPELIYVTNQVRDVTEMLEYAVGVIIDAYKSRGRDWRSDDSFYRDLNNLLNILLEDKKNNWWKINTSENRGKINAMRENGRQYFTFNRFARSTAKGLAPGVATEVGSVVVIGRKEIDENGRASSGFTQYLLLHELLHAIMDDEDNSLERAAVTPEQLAYIKDLKILLAQLRDNYEVVEKLASKIRTDSSGYWPYDDEEELKREKIIDVAVGILSGYLENETTGVISAKTLYSEDTETIPESTLKLLSPSGLTETKEERKKKMLSYMIDEFRNLITGDSIKSTIYKFYRSVRTYLQDVSYALPEEIRARIESTYARLLRSSDYSKFYINEFISSLSNNNITPQEAGVILMRVAWEHRGEFNSAIKAMLGAEEGDENVASIFLNLTREDYDKVFHDFYMIKDAEKKREIVEEAFRNMIAKIYEELKDSGMIADYDPERIPLLVFNMPLHPALPWNNVPFTASDRPKNLVPTNNPLEILARTLEHWAAIVEMSYSNKFKREIIDKVQEELSEDIPTQFAKRKYAGKALYDGSKDVLVYEEGVPYVYRLAQHAADWRYDLVGLLNNRVTHTPYMLQLLSFAIDAFKKIWVTYNPFFVATNITRDTKQMIRLLPDTINMSELKLAYRDAARFAYYKSFYDVSVSEYSKYLNQDEAEFFRALEQSGALLRDFSESIIDGNPMSAVRDIVRTEISNYKSKFMTEEESIGEFIHDSIFEKFKNFVDMSDKITKYSAALYLYRRSKSGQNNLKLEDIAEFVRRYAGTPDITKKGIFTVYLNRIFVFFNPRIQSIFANWDYLSKNKENLQRVLFRSLYLDFVPKSIAALAISGLLDKLLEILLGRENYDSKDAKFMKLYRNIPKYHLMTSTVIPLYLDVNDDKTLAVRFVDDTVGSFINAVAYGAVEAYQMNSYRKLLNNLLHAVVTDFPGKSEDLNPMLNLVSSLTSMLTGNNPIDPFTGRVIIDDKVFKASDAEAYGRLMLYSTFQIFGGFLPKREFLQDLFDFIKYNAEGKTKPSKEGDEISKFLYTLSSMPGVSRLVLYSNGGMKEELYRQYSKWIVVRDTQLYNYRKVGMKYFDYTMLDDPKYGKIKNRKELSRVVNKILNKAKNDELKGISKEDEERFKSTMVSALHAKGLLDTKLDVKENMGNMFVEYLKKDNPMLYNILKLN